MSFPGILSRAPPIITDTDVILRYHTKLSSAAFAEHSSRELPFSSRHTMTYWGENSSSYEMLVLLGDIQNLTSVIHFLSALVKVLKHSMTYD